MAATATTAEEAPKLVPRKSLVEVGEAAPDFELESTTAGERVRLSKVLAAQRRPLVVYFYPKDETPGCTAEACSFRDSFEQFTAAGAGAVIGISADSAESHRNFAQHHRLPFTLLSDPKGAVAAAYGVSASMFGLLPGRVTFVVDSGGIVRNIFNSQLRTGKHVESALETVRQLVAKQ